MPELPETETIARDLDVAVSGRTIVAVEVRAPDVLREVTPRHLRGATTGSVITRCWRRAKCVVIDLEPASHIVVQPRFTGALLLDGGRLPESELRFSTLHWTLDDGRHLHYRDIRRLGTVALMSTDRFRDYQTRFGPEPLDPLFTAEHLSAILRGSRQAVKKVLMDQRHLAGVGNIYANEALWRAGVDPSRASSSLSLEAAADVYRGLTTVLREAIAARGTSFRDYLDARGQPGSFAKQLAVYGRDGDRCLRCSHRLIGTHAIDGRMTVLCSRCQH